MAIGVAFRAFFSALFNRESAQRIRLALDQRHSEPQASTSTGQSTPKTESTTLKSKPAKQIPSRSDAITLLSTLQREARLVDLICEPLDEFSDAQIGAAAREVLRDSRKTMDRLFAIQPLAEQAEGATIDVSSDSSPARIRILGKSHSDRGTIVHRGWKATRCELPSWQGDGGDALIVTPTEVEARE